ncbi:MAG: HoxN/HupN/NixA family nickel/cobalt transporter [Acidobacteriaceae bacterium]|nr:HoxN/HupN/NixA family nickel/cobalt transporter [Acidobacteriaceae bacterium]
MQIGLHHFQARFRGQTRTRIVALYSGLLAFNVAAWVWAAIAFRPHPVLLGSAFLAYGFGLRHAVDADHIAAIDNVTRTMMQTGKRPVSLGLWFSLGHSTVVIFGSLFIAWSAVALQHRVAHFREIGGLIGTSVSMLFLFAIATVNLFVLRSVWQAFCRVRRGEEYYEQELDLLLGGGGFFARIFRSMFRLITESWHMYPLGLLFGLGFDTATEVGVLGISAAEAARGLSFTSMLIFPALFAAGMTLIDTTDNVLMLEAYGWAFAKPVRKLYYNLVVTSTSVLVALAVGGVEALGLLGEHWNASGPFWNIVARLNGHFGTLGYLIIAIMAGSWLLSMVLYKWRNFDMLDGVRE